MELVGNCKKCGKAVYCRDGFLDGVVDEDHQVVCNDCAQEESNKPKDE